MIGEIEVVRPLESIGEGVITTDRNGTIDYMNEAAEQLLGAARTAFTIAMARTVRPTASP